MLQRYDIIYKFYLQLSRTDAFWRMRRWREDANKAFSLSKQRNLFERSPCCNTSYRNQQNMLSTRLTSFGNTSFGPFSCRHTFVRSTCTSSLLLVVCSRVHLGDLPFPQHSIVLLNNFRPRENYRSFNGRPYWLKCRRKGPPKITFKMGTIIWISAISGTSVF